MKMINIRNIMWKAVPATPTTYNPHSVVTFHLRNVSIRTSSVRVAFDDYWRLNATD
jgi:hypothetical protein